jgi:hypothetical protein
MSHERRVDAVFPEERLLERKNTCRLRHRLRELGKTSGSPRPHLRSDVVQHRHLRFARRCSDFHVETRIIEQDDQADLAGLQAFTERAQQRPVLRDVRQHLDESHHRERFASFDDLDALGRQLRTPDPFHAHVGAQRA